eukprot:scaffold545437_cov38-Prasinocladus_malaysianus.AAC.1
MVCLTVGRGRLRPCRLALVPLAARETAAPPPRGPPAGLPRPTPSCDVPWQPSGPSPPSAGAKTGTTNNQRIKIARDNPTQLIS